VLINIDNRWDLTDSHVKCLLLGGYSHAKVYILKKKFVQQGRRGKTPPPQHTHTQYHILRVVDRDLNEDNVRMKIKENKVFIGT
jgi:hypothetical protein